MDTRRDIGTPDIWREQSAPNDTATKGRGASSPTPPTLEQQIEQLRNQPKREVMNPKRGSRKIQSSSTDVPTQSRIPRIPGREFAPRRPSREQAPEQAPSLRLRPQEQQLLADVGRFRVVSIADLQQALYPGQTRQLENDLAYLRDQGLVETHVLNLRRDGKSSRIEQFQAVVLTKTGQALTRRIGELPDDQRLYNGMVKQREGEHDSQIYRAYRKELPAILEKGGKNVRVRLDFELKSEFNRRVYQLGKQNPEADLATLKHHVASEMQLPMSRDRVVVPDARIEFDRPDGMTGRVEIEVVTAAYRHGHIAAKAQAGFKLYMSNGDIGRLGGAVADDHDLMSEVLEL